MGWGEKNLGHTRPHQNSPATSLNWLVTRACVTTGEPFARRTRIRGALPCVLVSCWHPLTWPVLDWSPRVLHAAVLAPMTKQTSLYFGSRHVKHQYFFNNASRRHQIKGKKSLERTVVRHMHGGIFQKDWSWRTTSLTFREFVAVISVP